MRSRHVLKGGSFTNCAESTVYLQSLIKDLGENLTQLDLFSISDIVNGCSNIDVSKKSFFYWTSTLSHLDNRTILHILLQ